MEFVDVSLYDCRRPNPNGTNTFIYDRSMDWSKQVANGAKFAFIKCSEYVEDPGFKVQWNAARKTSLILGAWHFFHPNGNAITQAQLQIGLLKQVGLNWTGDPKTSDKVQLDLETMDGLSAVSVAKAVGSWYYEINKVFPNFEKDIYVGYYFWYQLWESGIDMSWAENTKLWLPAYPLDPTPRTINPPPPFNKEKVDELDSGAFSTYAMKDLPPWGQPSYRQITGYADSRFVPGHPGIKKVVDIDVLNPNYFGNIPIPAPIPVPSNNLYYVNIGLANIRSGPSTVYPIVGTIALNTEVTVIGLPNNGYSMVGNARWIFSQYLTKK